MRSSSDCDCARTTKRRATAAGLLLIACGCSKSSTSLQPPCEYLGVWETTLGLSKSITLLVPHGQVTAGCLDRSRDIFIAHANNFKSLSMVIEDGNRWRFYGHGRYDPPRITLPHLAHRLDRESFSVATVFRVDYRERAYLVRSGQEVKLDVTGDSKEDPHEVQLSGWSARLQWFTFDQVATVNPKLKPAAAWYVTTSPLPTSEDRLLELCAWLIKQFGLEQTVFIGNVYVRSDANFQMLDGPAFDLQHPFPVYDDDQIRHSPYWACRLDSNGTTIPIKCTSQRTDEIRGLVP